MKSEIITIGDELLIGQVIDTNSAWIVEQLNTIGISVYQITSISDNRQHILTTLEEAQKRADIVLITGGLGPTKDDITKQTICEFFGSKLTLHQESLSLIKALLLRRGISEIIENNRNQAFVPDNCTVLLNHNGTAPCMWFEKNEKIFVFMPGVPFEMKAIISDQILPKLKTIFRLPEIVHKTIHVQGIPEALLAQKLETWEDNLHKSIKLAYLPSPSSIRLRFSAYGNLPNTASLREKRSNLIADEETERLLHGVYTEPVERVRNDKQNFEKQSLIEIINQEIIKLQKIIPQNIVSIDERKIEEVIGEILKSEKLTIATAESCTGGNIASLITSVSGSSEYFKGSVVSYANEIKIQELNVNAQDIEKYGAVSQQVVEQMATNVRSKFNVDYSIATSGIAGPNGGTAEKPVGTVWIAIASKNNVYSEKFQLGEHRGRNITRASNTALSMLKKFIND
ncbi:MAG TPA: damage-inducible protein CinA [Bacteroidales bacterium]|nr:MAG: hypothetical protein A2W98_00125 [Bacteroidetes bacterium GWF2_33_38]OFY74495.1 MAG: hypothetical protein A2265_08310 [Bacteroidetes bacterium RIFOXYA12_FULL_33_9]HBF87942.1 damage-inducible protein CinA [Bacteroidales bacterium]